MTIVAYYISDYGYGHATRSIAIIRKVLENHNTIKIIVCHSYAVDFIKQSIDSNRVSFRYLHTDVGYCLKEDAISIDEKRLNNKYEEFIKFWINKISLEKVFLQENKVDLVISDISPLPFEASALVNIPSIGLSNFTWYSAYQGLIEEKFLSVLKLAYEKMTYFFSLAGSTESWGGIQRQYNLFSRDIDQREVRRIRKQVNPKCDKKIIFIGLGMKIENNSLEQLSFWDNKEYIFITSSNIDVKKSNVYKIPEGYLESQNYIAAADLVISKAGWGTVAEAVAANVPLLLINREFMPEDRNTISFLKERRLCNTIEFDKLDTFQFDSKYFYKNNASCNFTDNVKIIYEDILKVINGSLKGVES